MESGLDMWKTASNVLEMTEICGNWIKCVGNVLGRAMWEIAWICGKPS